MGLGGSLPRSLDSERLGRILRLTRPQIERLLKPLQASAPGSWPKPEYGDREFSDALLDFVRGAEGLAAYQAAAREIEGKVQQWRLSLDRCIFRDITQHFFDNAEFRDIFPDGEAAEIGLDEVDAVGRFLAGRGEWARLSEFAWAVAMRTGNAAYLREAVSTHQELAEEVREIMDSLEEDETETAPEDEEAATEETPEAEPEDRLAEAVTVLQRIRAQINQFDAKDLDPEALNEVASDLGTLRELAAALKRQREAEAVLARFDEISTKFALTIAALDVETAMAEQRAGLTMPEAVVADVEAWLDGLAELLEAIAGLDGELQTLMRDISVAAADNDLDAIGRHTGVAQQKRAERDGKVAALRRHIGQEAASAAAVPPGAETPAADEEPAADEGESAGDGDTSEDEPATTPDF